MSKIGIGLFGLVAAVCSTVAAQNGCGTGEILMTDSTAVVYTDSSFNMPVVWNSSTIFEEPVGFGNVMYESAFPIAWGTYAVETPVMGWATPVSNVWVDECGCSHAVAMNYGSSNGFVTNDATYTSTVPMTEISGTVVEGEVGNIVEPNVNDEAIQELVTRIVSAQEENETTRQEEDGGFSDDNEDESSSDEIDN